MQPVHHLVAPAVVGAADLDHPLLAGEGPRAADGRHHALGAGAEHAEHLARRHEPVHQLGQLELVLVEEAGDRARLLHHFGDLAPDRLVVAAEDGRPARLQEVDVLVAVDVPEVGALGLLDRQRERVVEGEVVLHAAGDELHRLVGELLAAAALLVEVAEVAVHDVAADGTQRPGDEVVQPPVDVGDVRVAADGVAGELGPGGAGLAGRCRPRAPRPSGARARLRPPAPAVRSRARLRGAHVSGARLRGLARGPRLLHLRRQLLLVLAQLLEGDLADGQRHGLGAPVREQRQQVVQRHLLEQRHVVHGLLGVAAQHQHAVVLEDVRVGAVREPLRHVLLEEARPGRRVGDELHRAAEVAHLFVEQGGDRPLHQRQGARVGLVGVDDDAHVRAPLVHRGVHRGLDRRLLRARGCAGRRGRARRCRRAPSSRSRSSRA